MYLVFSTFMFLINKGGLVFEIRICKIISINKMIIMGTRVV